MGWRDLHRATCAQVQRATGISRESVKTAGVVWIVCEKADLQKHSWLLAILKMMWKFRINSPHISQDILNRIRHLSIATQPWIPGDWQDNPQWWWHTPWVPRCSGQGAAVRTAGSHDRHILHGRALRLKAAGSKLPGKGDLGHKQVFKSLSL